MSAKPAILHMGSTNYAKTKIKSHHMVYQSYISNCFYGNAMYEKCYASTYTDTCRCGVCVGGGGDSTLKMQCHYV